MYNELAHIYDWQGSLDFSERVLEKDLAILAAAGIAPPAKIIDLACGTGTLAVALAQKGYDVRGIDLSEAMLKQARRKQEEAEAALPLETVPPQREGEATGSPERNTLALCFDQGDMRFFQSQHMLPDEQVDAVLCHYDSLNHLSNETELRATFLQASQALRSGGLLIFDLNTLENYQSFWRGTDTDEGPNYRLRTVARFDEADSKAEVAYHVDEYLETGELVSREEHVREQYFNETAVEKYLLAAEFYDIAYEPFNPVDELPADFPLKTFWHARRR